MNYIAKQQDSLLIRSMGKSLRVMAIFTELADANSYMERHDNAACIACFGPFIFLADKYDNGAKT